MSQEQRKNRRKKNRDARRRLIFQLMIALGVTFVVALLALVLGAVALGKMGETQPNGPGTDKMVGEPYVGRTRNYFIQAEEVVWDYAPLDFDPVFNVKFPGYSAPVANNGGGHDHGATGQDGSGSGAGTGGHVHRKRHVNLPDDFCESKADGSYCSDEKTIVECAGSVLVGHGYECLSGCRQSMVSAATCVDHESLCLPHAATAADHAGTGWFCSPYGAFKVMCHHGANMTVTMPCEFGCDSDTSECFRSFCEAQSKQFPGKMWFCDGFENERVMCMAGVETQRQQCDAAQLQTCAMEDATTDDFCQDFCSVRRQPDKQWYCDLSLRSRVKCVDGSLAPPPDHQDRCPSMNKVCEQTWVAGQQDRCVDFQVRSEFCQGKQDGAHCYDQRTDVLVTCAQNEPVSHQVCPGDNSMCMNAMCHGEPEQHGDDGDPHADHSTAELHPHHPIPAHLHFGPGSGMHGVSSVRKGTDRLGKEYRKCVYVAYTDSSFSQRKQRTMDEQHLGILGPVIRGLVGDSITIHYRNNCSFPNSMHPHGLFYKEQDEGAVYHRGGEGEGEGEEEGGGADSHSSEQAVEPGGHKIYEWEARARSGPVAESGQSTVAWDYHSHVDSVSDSNAGLVGVIIIGSPDQCNHETARPLDVDREIVTLFNIFDENVSPYWTRNIEELALDPAGVASLLNSEDFFESNRMHSINGRVHGNLQHVSLPYTGSTRWYVFALGNQRDLHTVHWHGIVGTHRNVRSDVVSLLPGQIEQIDLINDNKGSFLFHCHVDHHIHVGMYSLFTVQ